MIVRLEKEQQKSARRKLLADPVYIISHDALRKMKQDGHTQLSPVELFLSAQEFCETLLALPDVMEGLDDEIDDLEDEAEGENDAMLIMTLATAQLQARSKKCVGIDIRKIILHIYERLDGHDLLWPLIEQMTDKEEYRRKADGYHKAGLRRRMDEEYVYVTFKFPKKYGLALTKALYEEEADEIMSYFKTRKEETIWK